MNRCLFFFLFSFFVIDLHAQNEVIKPKDANYYVDILDHSKDSLYEKILDDYDLYIKFHPEDFEISIEKCRVIELAYYDAYEDYNPLHDEFLDCLAELSNRFPENQDVLNYKLDNLWGDSAKSLGNMIMKLDSTYPEKFDYIKMGLVYEKMSRIYDSEDETRIALEYALDAQYRIDSLDLSLRISEYYLTLNQYELAKNVLLENLDSTDNSWDLVQKGEQFLELGLDSAAISAFDMAEKDTNSWIPYDKIAEVLINLGRFEEARKYIVKDLANSYDSTSALFELFQYDYAHSPVDSVVASYKKLNQLSYLNDALGWYRIKMMFKAPFDAWTWYDPLKLLIFLAAILIFVLIPYLLILPIHYLSDYLKIKNIKLSFQNSNWTLKHFWILISMYFIVDLFGSMLFDYESLIRSYFEDYYYEDSARISLNQANYSIFYTLVVFVFILYFSLRKKFGHFNTGNKWPISQSIIMGVGSAVFLRVIYFGLVKVGIFPDASSYSMASVIDSIVSINKYYHPLLGFLLIVIIVPFYEELMFRAIILSSVEKKLKFITANCLQAFLFALVHQNMQLLLFYFAFGLIAGSFVRKSGSMIASYVFHATNNLLAFMAILTLS